MLIAFCFSWWRRPSGRQPSSLTPAPFRAALAVPFVGGRRSPRPPPRFFCQGAAFYPECFCEAQPRRSAFVKRGLQLLRLVVAVIAAYRLHAAIRRRICKPSRHLAPTSHASAPTPPTVIPPSAKTSSHRTVIPSAARNLHCLCAALTGTSPARLALQRSAVSGHGFQPCRKACKNRAAWPRRFVVLSFAAS